MKQADYIIAGQGIAGSVLALSLYNRGKSVLIVDEGLPFSSSKVAAGICNPLVFKRLAKSWKSDEALPYLEKFYADAEALLTEKLFVKKKFLKLFSAQTEINFWKKREQETGFAGYLGPTGDAPAGLHSAYGCGEVLQTGHLRVSRFLERTREFFLSRDEMITEEFDFSQLRFSGSGVSYKAFSAAKIVFCEGYRVLKNPLFSWLPMKLTKGELLLIEAPGLNLHSIANKGIYLLPHGNDLYTAGATYEWEDLTESPTEKGLEELRSRLDKLLEIPYKVVDHKAGIRPTVIDRRPILGAHPRFKNAFVLNGLGTKGVMLAPLMAHTLLEFSENGRVLDAEISLERFLSDFDERNVSTFNSN